MPTHHDLSPEDTAFLTDPGTYTGGPTFDVCWELGDASALPNLRRSVLADSEIIADVPGLAPASNDYARVVWRPQGLRPLALTLSEILSGGQAELYGFAYPPHVRRCAGVPWEREEEMLDPRTHALYAAAVALVRRIHQRTPLLRARIFDEGTDTEVPEAGVIALPRAVAESACWAHTLTVYTVNGLEPWVALLPLDG